MIKIFLTNLGKYNEGELVGEWVTLPCEEEDIKEVFERIGINEEYEEYFITDYESSFDIEIGEYSNFNKLNELAEELERINQNAYDRIVTKVNTIINYESVEYVEDILKIINDSNLDNYHFYPDVKNDEELGEYIVNELAIYDIPENLVYYIDYEKIGHDWSINNSGLFTQNGYIEKCC